MSIIKLVGIGGTGAEFFRRTRNDPGLSGIKLFLIDTDEKSPSNLGNVTKILIGKDLLRGKGAACKPEMGELAIHGDLDYVLKTLNLTKTDRVFIFAGFGGGTGTGVLPVLMGALKKMVTVHEKKHKKTCIPTFHFILLHNGICNQIPGKTSHF